MQPDLLVEARGTVALLDAADAARVRFEGVAVGVGVFTDVAGRQVRVTERHLPLIAGRLPGVFIRDLHHEDMRATVGVVDGADVDRSEVRFRAEVRVQPFVDVVRAFWERLRFSLGFRYDAARLQPNGDGTYDLPDDFVLDHLAVVPRGQFEGARVLQLLNELRQGGGAGLHADKDGTHEPAEDATMDAKEAEQLRAQRDEALKASEAARAELADAKLSLQRDLDTARVDLVKVKGDADAAGKLAEQARLELGKAKNRLAAEVMKLELGQGKDFDLEDRRAALAAMDLAALDKLRGELHAAAAQAGAPAREPASKPEGPAAGAPKGAGLDLEKLSLTDTLRLAFHQGAL